MSKSVLHFGAIIVSNSNMVLLVPIGLIYKPIWSIQQLAIPPIEGWVICNIIVNCILGNKYSNTLL